jgi:hypothetical protein
LTAGGSAGRCRRGFLDEEASLVVRDLAVMPADGGECLSDLRPRPFASVADCGSGCDRARCRAKDENQEPRLTRPHFSRFPVSLTEAGLAGAVRELTDDSQIPVRVETTTERRPRPAAEAAVYRLVLDRVRLAERCGNGAPVTVRVESGDDSVSVQITAPSVDSAAHPLIARLDRPCLLPWDRRSRP